MSLSNLLAILSLPSPSSSLPLTISLPLPPSLPLSLLLSMCVHIIEQRSTLEVFFNCSLLYLWDKTFLWSWNSRWATDELAVKPGWYSCLWLPSAGLYKCKMTGQLNSDTQNCTSTLPTAVSPNLHNLLKSVLLVYITICNNGFIMTVLYILMSFYHIHILLLSLISLPFLLWEAKPMPFWDCLPS